MERETDKIEDLRDCEDCLVSGIYALLGACKRIKCPVLTLSKPKEKGILVIVEPEDTAIWFHKFLDRILEKCRVSELTGDWACKRCGNLVEVDWFEKTKECLGCDEV